ncbi:hypothetical protein [Sphingomonas alpina]|nr:hypothetical protein [Sphingomonas alpina]
MALFYPSQRSVTTLQRAIDSFIAIKPFLWLAKVDRGPPCS